MINIICECGCTEFKEVNKYYEQHYLVEYKIKCLSCGTIVGHWAYGSWQDKEVID